MYKLRNLIATSQVVLVVVSVTDLAELSPAFRESFTHEVGCVSA